MSRYSTIYDDKTHKQRPARRGVTKALRQTFHWKCLLFTLLIHACALYAIWCHLNRYDASTFAGLSAALSDYVGVGRVCTHGYSLILGVVSLLLYAIYLAECWHYRQRLAAVPMCSSAQIYALARRMRDAIPIVWWKSVCYHYLRRTRQVTRYRNGDAITATQVYYERINSHSSGNVFRYDTCGYKDISKELTDLGGYPLIRIRFTKGFVFACVQAADEFQEQRTRFFNENEVRDDYMEVREGLDLAGVPFVEQIFVYAAPPATGEEGDESSSEAGQCWTAPWYMRPTAYWIASTLLLSWPLRMLTECRMAHLTYQVTKLFGTNYLSPSSVNYTGPLTRTSTMDSCELALANRNNYIIIPSYSEAILLDPLNHNNYASGNDSLRPVHNGEHNNRMRNEARLESNECLIFANYGTIGDDGPTHNDVAPQSIRCGYESLDGCAADCWPVRLARDDDFLSASSYSPYRQVMQRLMAGMRQGASAVRGQNGGEFSLYKRFNDIGLRHFSLASMTTPRQMRSKSMTFTIGQTPAVRIPRPSQLRGGAAFRPQLNANLNREDGKPLPRSITFAEGMHVSDLTRRTDYEYSTQIDTADGAPPATSLPPLQYREACDAVAVERGTRRVIAAGVDYGNDSPFRRATAAFAVGSVNEPPPPYEVLYDLYSIF